MKKLFILVCIMLSTIFAFSNDNTKINRYLKELDGLTNKQLEVLVKSFIVGDKYDLGIELAAIAWKESSFGVNLINKKDGKYGSYGIYQINLEWAVIRARAKTDKERKIVINKLLHDFSYSSASAITELIFWRDINKSKKRSDWYKRMFMSYNGGGYGYKIKSSVRYADDVVLRIKALEKFFDKYDIIEIMRDQFTDVDEEGKYSKLYEHYKAYQVTFKDQKTNNTVAAVPARKETSEQDSDSIYKKRT